ncbi:N-acetylglucosamine-6-phosphate deacetylase [Diaminobutyricimonas sp. LJ205]|uniref:N-acetylglucosamine-6-phosphate deacetylase n=1 Tax=Diaminobutyricimonas sp. LJ205 TaxID=2683590 RepID=UPI0012F4A45F|nr:N-acetylglucosamine-6-phosphate deacetylase [Diaminobutyricimonas sp. LJ205]
MSMLISGARKLDANGEQDDFWMLVDGDTITATGQGEAPDAATRVDATGKWLVPGFIDLHGHGGGGHVFDDGPDEIEAALATHRAHGTTRSVISLVANPVSALTSSLATIAEITERDPLVLGAHLEGPFLTPARRGAHNVNFLLQPSMEVARELLDAGNGILRQVTIAPELPGALEVIDLLVEHGVTVAVGHTEATAEQAAAAFDRGARLLTHAFNAMPGIHHRAPGPVVAALADERVTVELILDGLHVHPDVASLVFTKALNRVALVTDAMAAAGAADGHYRLGSLNVTVRNGLAVLSGTDTLAGSTLTQDAALRNAITLVGLDARAAVEAVTLTPARALGLEHRHGLLAEGFAADAVLLDSDWQVSSVFADGRRIGAHETQPAA